VSSDGRDRTVLALGEAFTPGSDSSHFCQPTDVAVDGDTGNIFVSDGYCNARILKFSADGRYLSEWGAGRKLAQHCRQFKHSKTVELVDAAQGHSTGNHTLELYPPIHIAQRHSSRFSFLFTQPTIHLKN